MATESGRRFSPKRFKQLIAYIVAKVGRPVTEDELNWALYRCDMDSFVATGRSLTGATYIKGENSPIPCHK